MAARDKERYFWLKLHRNFFKRHDIRILENMPNGKELVLLYLKLLAESVDHEGALRFSDTLPYSEEMLASVTGTAAEIVHAAMQVFQNLNLLEVQEDGTIFLPAAAKLLDSETYQTKRKREAADAASLLPGAKYTPDKVKPTREKETDAFWKHGTRLGCSRFPGSQQDRSGAQCFMQESRNTARTLCWRQLKRSGAVTS